MNSSKNVTALMIGKVCIKPPLILAPMAGYTDQAFRQICKANGAGLVCTEFVSSDGLARSSEKTYDYLRFSDFERPISMQIFGNNPVVMAEAANLIENEFHPDLIDINAGCSVRKVIKKNAGSALLKNPPLLEKIVRAVVEAVSVPVTIKMRSGWDRQSIIAVEIAQRLEQTGIKAITIHPRTAVDGFRHPADWSLITEMKKKVNLPIIGNGDVFTPTAALRMFTETNCDAVMIGRGALGNPWIFRQIADLLENKPTISYDSPAERVKLCRRQLEMEIQYRGETVAHKEMKKFYRWYLRGFGHVSEIREKLVRSKNAQEAFSIFDELAQII
ncbi:MAG TPA: tRNA dihydrouridine synthase DusB [Candidatus Marinimicrobia bacterium]|nr:tRNA dihydrouridine synthase DusB [Candidatus Neomarinimicrobiota bacterium]